MFCVLERPAAGRALWLGAGGHAGRVGRVGCLAGDVREGGREGYDGRREGGKPESG